MEDYEPINQKDDGQKDSNMFFIIIIMGVLVGSFFVIENIYDEKKQHYIDIGKNESGLACINTFNQYNQFIIQEVANKGGITLQTPEGMIQLVDSRLCG